MTSTGKVRPGMVKMGTPPKNSENLVGMQGPVGADSSHLNKWRHLKRGKDLQETKRESCCCCCWQGKQRGRRTENKTLPASMVAEVTINFRSVLRLMTVSVTRFVEKNEASWGTHKPNGTVSNHRLLGAPTLPQNTKQNVRIERSLMSFIHDNRRVPIQVGFMETLPKQHTIRHVCTTSEQSELRHRARVQQQCPTPRPEITHT